MENQYLAVLKSRIIEISSLSEINGEKKELINKLFSRYTSDLEDALKKSKTSEEILKDFNHYINNVLSILETFSTTEAFKPTRRLILNEIHGCKDQFIKENK